MRQLPPLSLYIHIPWCVRKCPYCDFNSHRAGDEIPEEAYVSALIDDLGNDLSFVQGRKLTSIFFGGGTPSLFSAHAIGSILDRAEGLIGFDGEIEITLEANPGTFEQKKFRGYRSAGVNRLSLGIQSFNERHLTRLGRIHNAGDAVHAAASAQRAGFDNFNLDLMHGLPEQTVDEALEDIAQAVQLEPSHLSWYQLTIEANTEFYKQPPRLPVEDILDDIQVRGQEKLNDAGYRRYEISAYARGDRRSRHNLNYWQFGDYLGIGAGAHGKITMSDRREIVRTAKTRTPADYLVRASAHSESYAARQHSISADDLPMEFFMNALRLDEGVPATYYSERTGLDFADMAHRWDSLVNGGLLQPAGQRLAATERGLMFLNDVLRNLA